MGDERESQVGPEPSENPTAWVWPGGLPSGGRSHMAERSEVDADAIERLEFNPEPIEIPTPWKPPPPPPPDPCACEAFAVHRPGLNETPGISGVRLASLPPGNVSLPPLAQLYLVPGSYVVSAKASVFNRQFGTGGMLLAFLGTPGQGNLSWTWLRIQGSSQPGDCQIVNLQCVVTIAEADRQTDRIISLSAYGGTANYTFAAYDIWLTAQEVGKATVFTIT